MTPPSIIAGDEIVHALVAAHPQPRDAMIATATAALIRDGHEPDRAPVAARWLVWRALSIVGRRGAK